MQLNSRLKTLITVRDAVRETVSDAVTRTVPVAAVTVVLLLAIGCSTADSDAARVTAQTPVPAAAPTGTWSAALQQTPYPYLLPLPDPERTVLDGTYAKFEAKEAPRVHCLRCPDYAPEGGIWKLNLDRGIFRVYHAVTGWHSLGSFVLVRDRRTADTSDQLLLFNDPACPGAVGLYTWKLQERNLILEAVHDTCSIHLRAINLTNLPWPSCQPPNIEAGITDHWQKPPGCG
jgi:hypothetical protein